MLKIEWVSTNARPGRIVPVEPTNDSICRILIWSMRNQILAVIRKVPRGHVSTYGAIARAAGYPGAARQVVGVLHSGFDLPWHRIVGAGGEIKLRGDSAMEQRFRLETEGVTFRGRRVNMRAHEHRFERTRNVAKRGKKAVTKRKKAGGKGAGRSSR
jgi:alkylated DNA nucleotide flippase Atl1